MSATLGRNTQTNHLITIGEKERCGGLYVLGQPRTGKSTLLVSLALSDIEKGYGVVFIDPHTDAINDLAARIPSSREDDIVLLDPTNKSNSFGINLLHCADPSDPLELDKTYGRVRDIFLKIWGDQTGQLGVWIEKILRNSVYLLVENPGHTLVEVPLLLSDDTRFRNSLLENVKINPYIKDFWYDEFDRLSKRDKTDQVGPALSRLDIFRTNTMIRHIVGQRQSTIDFYDIINNADRQKIVLLRMPTQLSSDVKTLIATMILSEIVHAVFGRAEIPERDRRFFGLFCDEFHDFATPDFAKLFTETGKHKVMPVVAHHERLGQFKPGDPNQGATLAAPNKVLFTLSVHDAGELALEFAEEPPVEIRREQELVVSQTPLTDLLNRGHKNAEVQAFVSKYLRPMRERREDAKEEMERERLIRMGYLDEAGLYALDERMESVGNYERHIRLGSLQKRGYALREAGTQTRVLLRLFDLHNNLRLTERKLNSFLAGVMEGRNAQGQEQFSDFLISLVEGFEGVESAHLEALRLYIALSYGDQARARVIPFGLARAQGLYSQEVALLTDQSEEKTREERGRFKEKFLREEEERKLNWWRQEREDGVKKALKRNDYLLTKRRENRCISWGNTERRWKRILAAEKSFWYPPNVYSRYVWIARFREIYKMLAPFYRAKFSEDWRSFLPGTSNEDPVAKIILSLETRKEWDCRHGIYEEYWKENALRDLIGFICKFRESGLVMLSLLDCAASGSWTDSGLEVPGIEGVCPVDVWCFVETLRRCMYEKLRGQWFSQVFKREFRCTSLSWESDDAKLDDAMFLTSVAEKPIYEYMKRREGARWLEDLLRWRWGWFSAKYKLQAELWNRLDECRRGYLLGRADDRITYGIGYGEERFCLPASGNPMYEALVNGLVDLREDTDVWIYEEDEKWETETQRKYILERCEKEVASISYSPPDMLESRVLSGSEIRNARQACVNQLRQASEETRGVAATIDEFVQFCALLARPENHIQVPCGQYIEREVRTRQEADMSNEAARKLTELPKYTAYAKIIREIGGEQIVWKGKIQTLRLAGEGTEEEASTRRAVIERSSMKYLRSRAEIEEEIRLRQEKWRGRVLKEPPKTQSEVVNGRLPPSGEADIRADVPPPPTQSPPGDKSDEPPPIHG